MWLSWMGKKNPFATHIRREMARFLAWSGLQQMAGHAIIDMM